MVNHDSQTIELGPNSSIELTDLEGRYHQAVNIDEMVRPIAPFWKGLETICKAECCGIRAFDFSTEHVRQVFRSLDSLEPIFLMDQLLELLSFVGEHESDTFVSEELNQYFDREDLTKLLEHLIESLSDESLIGRTRPSGFRKYFGTATTVVTFGAAAMLWFRPLWALWIVVAILVWVMLGLFFLFRDSRV